MESFPVFFNSEYLSDIAKEKSLDQDVLLKTERKRIVAYLTSVVLRGRRVINLEINPRLNKVYRLKLAKELFRCFVGCLYIEKYISKPIPGTLRKHIEKKWVIVKKSTVYDGCHYKIHL